MSTDRYRAVPFSAYSLGRHRSLLYSREVDAVTDIETVLAWVLGLAQGARTLDEHANDISRAGAGGDPSGLSSTIEALERSGLLRTTRALEGLRAAQPVVGDPTPITTIGVITADRPAAVRRSAESLVRHCQTYGQRPRLLVIDGSRESVNQTATRAAVSTVAAAGHLDAQDIGAEAAGHFREALSSRGRDASALTPGTAGANRNLLLLMTAGEHVLLVDDDVICEPRSLATRDDGMAVTGHHQTFRETTFVPHRPAALAATVPVSADVLATNAALLGRSVPELLAASPMPPDLTHGCPHIFSRLLADRPHVVKVTFAGLVGDSGTYCPHRLLFSRFHRGRFWANPAMFTTAMASREVVRIATRNVITHDRACMAACMGLSNRTVVPPFTPVGRNEDGVFGVMLAVCDPTAVFAHLPVGIVHDSDRPSDRAREPIVSATQSRVSELIIALIQRLESSTFATPPAERMRRIGGALADLGALDTQDLVDLVTETTLERRCRELEEADRAAETPGCPDQWRAELDRYRAEFLVSVTRREFFLPIEFHGLGSIDAGYRALQTFLGSFGRLVASWPDLWDVARDLNANRGIV